MGLFTMKYCLVDVNLAIFSQITIKGTVVYGVPCLDYFYQNMKKKSSSKQLFEGGPAFYSGTAEN